jgi:hypothetical protein
MRSKDDRIDEAELERLGIRHVDANVFQRGQYIYSSLEDALEAAKLAEKR